MSWGDDDEGGGLSPQGSPHAPASEEYEAPQAPPGAPQHPRLKSEWGWSKNVALRAPDAAELADTRLLVTGGVSLWSGLNLQDDPRYHKNPDAEIPDWFELHITNLGATGLLAFLFQPNAPAGTFPSGQFALASSGTQRVVVPRASVIKGYAYTPGGIAAASVVNVAAMPTPYPETTEGVWFLDQQSPAAGAIQIATATPWQGSLSSDWYTDVANVTLAFTGLGAAPGAIPIPAAAPPLQLGALPANLAITATGLAQFNLFVSHRVRLPW